MRFSSRGLAAAAVATGAAGIALRWQVPGQAAAAAGYALLVLALALAFAALLRLGRADVCGDALPALRRRYMRELLGSMGAYVAVLFASAWLLKRVDEPLLRALLAIAPVPPIAFALRAMVRYIRDTDEMQRRIELEAVSIAAAFVSMLYMTGGFLQSAKVIDVPSAAAMIWVFPLVCFSYGVAKALVARRYG